MTSNSHHSGTDRIAEVIKRPEYSGVKIVVNVQGDEPDIDPGIIDSLISALTDNADIHMATASCPFVHPRDAANPNAVKVVVDERSCALYFSRAIIPFDRDHSINGIAHPAISPYRKHLGIYAYKREALLQLSAAPMCDLERLEKLEQLRALYLGMRIFVLHTTHAPNGVDTPEDYAAFVRRYHQSSQDNHT
jgi:3-deoxy-manno-octulosonate cytidylyltransferase (CMP-KDO synthetase)